MTPREKRALADAQMLAKIDAAVAVYEARKEIPVQRGR